MNASHSYIDLHTHKPGKPGVKSLQNIFLSDFEKFSGTKDQLLSVGLHPWRVRGQEDPDLLFQQLKFAAGYQQVAAIGETGLDKSIEMPLERQEAVFNIHFEVSEELQKPLIIHCVRAYQELLLLRKNLGATQPWIFHGFAGSAQLARQCINSGCLLSFGPAILKDHNRAVHSLISLGIDEFFLETDDSGLDIAEIYERAALLKQTTVEVLRERIAERFHKIIIQE
ncbi:MAG: TatD family hydrolase [Bacteroidales bacterium]|nr:TatD family hydrolase [Bacteroidales bacterium]